MTVKRKRITEQEQQLNIKYTEKGRLLLIANLNRNWFWLAQFLPGLMSYAAAAKKKLPDRIAA